jgi:N-acetylglutamate synthase-like GNAT family acetyltransferase
MPSQNREALSMPVSDGEVVVEIATDLARIDLDRVHDWLARKSYWAGRLPQSVLQRAVQGSLRFAAIERRATVGFCRAISDRATFAYLSDMFVAPDRRGRGIGKAIMTAILAHPDLQNLRRWVLVTGDAHGLYARHGFQSLVAPERFMERCDPEVYQRMADGAET